MHRLFAAHLLTSYFILAFAGTWLLQVPMIVSADGLGLFQYQVPFPLFILSSYAGSMLGAVLVIIGVTVIFAWIFNTGRQSTLIAVLPHASFNATGVWLNGIMEIPISAGLVVYGIIAAVALVLVAVTRGRLGYDKTPALAAQPAAEAAGVD